VTVAPERSVWSAEVAKGRLCLKTRAREKVGRSVCVKRLNNLSKIMNSEKKQEYIEEFDFPFCSEATKYEIVAKIG
jgi:hypothetical protein